MSAKVHFLHIGKTGGSASTETPQLNTSQLHEIALSELNNASIEFHKGIEIYTTILDHYNRANHERIIRISKIF